MSAAITETAKAKVNLALHILGRRADGYHDIDSAVAFAETSDELEVDVCDGEGVRLSIDGPFAHAVPGGADNLISRAHALLQQAIPLPAVRVRLHKVLPVAAGIGGGSADAAAALRAFVKLSGPVAPSVVDAVAVKLGADVPVCFRQSASRMRGVGEQLSPLPTLPAAAIVLVNPGVACETAAVFAAIGLRKGQAYRSGLEVDQPSTWRNDMTDAAISVQPVIADVLATLSRQPLLGGVRMSGSGATCFGLAPDLATAERVADAMRAAHPSWWVKAARLS